MKKLIMFLCGMSFASVTLASSGVHLDSVDIDVSDQASLQKGAKTYVNYCMGCHALGFMRYNRMAKDIGLPEDAVMENLAFPKAKIGEQMHIAMPKDKAKQWFGTPPPDLSLIARSRGTDWLYTYLRSFYKDDSRPMGVNNTLFKDVGMPHVLLGLQGQQELIKKGDEVALEQVSAGQLSTKAYDETVRDLVNFLAYVGEPGQLARKSLGYKVILFLMGFFVLAYLLKKEYWRDIH